MTLAWVWAGGDQGADFASKLDLLMTRLLGIKPDPDVAGVNNGGLEMSLTETGDHWKRSGFRK